MVCYEVMDKALNMGSCTTKNLTIVLMLHHVNAYSLCFQLINIFPAISSWKLYLLPSGFVMELDVT